MTVAYKGSGKKAQYNAQGGKRSQKSLFDKMLEQGSQKPQQRKSKGQSGSGGNSRKVHDTKGRNTHGRRSW